MGYQAAEENLCHLVMGIDIKQIDHSDGIYGSIDPLCCDTAEKIQAGSKEKGMISSGVNLPLVYHGRKDAGENEDNMPEIGVDGQPQNRIMHTAGICEGGNPSEHTVTHQKLQQDTANLPVFDPGQHKKNIHGNAAELKRKIPPQIGTMVDPEGQVELLADFTGGKQGTGQEEKAIPALK